MLCYILTDRRADLFSERREEEATIEGVRLLYSKRVSEHFLKLTHNTSCTITRTISIAYTYIMQYITLCEFASLRKRTIESYIYIFQDALIQMQDLND